VTATDTDGLIKEFIAALCSDPSDADYRKPIPSNVEVTSYSLDGVLLTLDFDEDYSAMSTVEEVLCRAAVVRTLTQIDGVDCVNFYVGETPLTDAEGNVVGNMYQESFIENPGEQINSFQNTTLTLYFSNEDGDGLIKETRSDVYYSSNMSLEKLVMEELLEGTSVSGEKSAIPEGTRLVNVSVVDGVCYVSLDENFRNQDYKVNEAIVIYSIVDSLTELSTVGKVQISVNGDTSGVYRDNYSLDSVYERNLDYVTDKKTGESVEGFSTEE
jgi:germination protein M